MFNCNITPREGASQSATMNLRDSLSKPSRELWSCRPNEATTAPRPRVLLLLAGAILTAVAYAAVSLASRGGHATQHRCLKTEAQLRESLLKAFKCLDPAHDKDFVEYSIQALERSDDTDFSRYFEELILQVRDWDPQDCWQNALLAIIQITSHTPDTTTLLELFLQAADLLPHADLTGAIKNATTLHDGIPEIIASFLPPGRLEQILSSKDTVGNNFFHNMFDEQVTIDPKQFSVILEALPQHQDILDAIADVTMHIGCPAVIGNIIASNRPPNLRSELLNQISPCTGHTPFMEAVLQSAPGEILPNVQLLVNAGADPNLSTRHGTLLDFVNGELQNYPDFLRAIQPEVIEDLQAVKTYLESVME